MTVSQTTEKKFATYSLHAKNWLKENEIKIKVVYVSDANYNPHFIYMNRIANCGKPKFRILQPGKDNVKNCIMITFNTETVDKAYLTYLIQSKLKLFSFCSHGSCQRFVTIDIVGQIISGTIGKNGIAIKTLLY